MHPDQALIYPALSIGYVYRRALDTYRHRFLQVAGMALLVFGPLSVLSTIASFGAEHAGDEVGGTAGIITYLLVLINSSAVVFGSAFYSGLLDHVVGVHRNRHERRPVLHLVRTLPYRRLIVANLLLSLIVAVGLSLFVVPGIVLFTLFVLVGPMINIERRTVLGAFRRSARLIRPHFWLALVAVTVLVGAERGVHHSIEEFIHQRGSIAVSFVLGGLLAATVGAVVGLVEVTLAYELVERDLVRSSEPIAPPAGDIARNGPGVAYPNHLS
jgi:hypothetical protein